MYLRDGSAQTIVRAATLEIEVADQTFYLTLSQSTDTGPTSPSADPITPGAWQGSQFLSHWYDSTRKNPVASGIRTPDLSLPRWTPLPLGQRGGFPPRRLTLQGDSHGCFARCQCETVTASLMWNFYLGVAALTNV